MPNGARRHAGFYALELLADDQSTSFDKAVVRAIFQIGWRDRADATPAEWALLYLAEQLLALKRLEAYPQ